MSEVLRIEKLRIVLGGQNVLRDASLGVPAGAVHGLVGESGAGKTVIGKAVLGILPSAARIAGGNIRFETQDVTHLSERARRTLLGRGIAMIPQDPMSSLNPAFRIGSQIADVLRLHLGMSARAARARVLELLHQVHIRQPERVLRQYPHELSGGMRQRVLIAIAFACRPRLIVADEPSTALDVTVQRQVLRLIKELQAQENTAVLFITHDLGVVAKICDTMTVLHGGRVLEDGPVAACFERPSHPYTRALMAATPRHDRPADELRPVPASLTRELAAEAAAWDRDQGPIAASAATPCCSPGVALRTAPSRSRPYRRPAMSTSTIVQAQLVWMAAIVLRAPLTFVNDQLKAPIVPLQTSPLATKGCCVASRQAPNESSAAASTEMRCSKADRDG